MVFLVHAFPSWRLGGLSRELDRPPVQLLVWWPHHNHTWELYLNLVVFLINKQPQINQSNNYLVHKLSLLNTYLSSFISKTTNSLCILESMWIRSLSITTEPLIWENNSLLKIIWVIYSTKDIDYLYAFH